MHIYNAERQLVPVCTHV